ncbi:MAG: hypothetical protein ACSI46_18365 [Gloeotrichia echinulata DVL01]
MFRYKPRSLWAEQIQNPKLVLSVRAASRREVVGVASRREVSKILKPRTLVVGVNPKSKIQNPKSVDRQEFRSEIRQIWQYLRDGTASAADIATVVVAHLIIDGLRRSDACGERSYRVQG